jgi:dolichyl-phosphate beta-glucosyltransferase
VKRRLRRFAAVSAVVTVLDVVILVVLVTVVGWSVPAADAVAITVAAVASWSLHRAVAAPGDPFRRWVQRPATFAYTALLTGILDVLLLTALVGARPKTTWQLVGAKVVALVVAGALRALAYRLVVFPDTRERLAQRIDRPTPPGSVRLTVVVPAFREEARIASSIAGIEAALAGVAADGGLEVLVVDDGSGDRTAEVAEAAGARVVRLPENRGKGAAVRAGMLAGSGRTIVFTDADLAYPPEQILALLAEVEAGWDVVVGSRRHSGSDTAEISRLRWLSGKLFNLLTGIVLLGQYRDTQCGLKAFRADVARLVFGHTRLERFAFDVEVFHLVERYGLSLREVPVTLVTSEGSTVRVGSDALTMIADLFKVRRWAGQGVYDVEERTVIGGAGPERR